MSTTETTAPAPHSTAQVDLPGGPLNLPRAHPIFVYGTLRPGQGNDILWRGHATAHFDGEAQAAGLALHDRGPFPYAVPATDNLIVGCLIVPTPGAYDAVLRRMDELEGVPHHYVRTTVAVYLPDDRIEVAYTYVATDAETVRARLPLVESQDWSRFRAL